MSGNLQLFSKSVQTFLNASAIGQDRIIRKEVSLGNVREIQPPDYHMGLNFAPWLEVATDDVIFGYIKGDVDGLAPARAEDAESELAQKDDIAYGQGRANIIDWAVKDHYDASDVNRYREFLKIVEAMKAGSLPMYVSSALEDFASKVARDTMKRRRKLDNRIEHMNMTAMATAAYSYNDGKIKFTVDWGRPASQAAGNAANTVGGVTAGTYDMTSATNDFDPVKFIEDVKQYFEDTYSVQIDRAVVSKKILRRMSQSAKFTQLAGLGAAYSGAGTAGAPDPNYLIPGWGMEAAVRVIEQAANIEFIVNDAVYRTRPLGSSTITNNRFWPQNLMVFLPAQQSIDDVDDTAIGFAKTLTSPHPEGNWTPGFYEWERATVDPWGQDMGTGVKAFPVFPHMDLTHAVNVTGI
jgi:hypothetical protein